MNIHEKAQQLRHAITQSGMAVGVGAGTALEAKLIEKDGFDFVWSSSLVVSAFHAAPDASLLSMNQCLEAARSRVEVIDIPFVADCDTGYGNANNVIDTTRLFEETVRNRPRSRRSPAKSARQKITSAAQISR